MTISTKNARLTGLLAAGALAASTLTLGAPAAHAENGRNMRNGSIAAAALGAYWLSRGKTTEGAAALGGAYVLYRQSEKERENSRLAQPPRRPIYPTATRR